MEYIDLENTTLNDEEKEREEREEKERQEKMAKAFSSAFTKLDEEIAEQEESRKIKTKAQKRRRRKARIRASLIGLAATLGIGGVGALTYSSLNGDLGYNNAIQSSYRKTINLLENRLSQVSSYEKLLDPVIQDIYFQEQDNGELNFVVSFDGKSKEYNWEYLQGSANYKILKAYYETLQNAREENNMLAYIDALYDIVSNMEYQYSGNWDYIEIFRGDKTEEEMSKILELFELDVQKEGVKRQIGFLPYHIKCVNWYFNEETNETEYEYRIAGISYCETEEKNSDPIREHSEKQDLLMTQNYDQNHIKAYYRDISFKSKCPVKLQAIDSASSRIAGDINMLLNGNKTLDDFEVKTLYFDETSIFDDFSKIAEGQSFEKPEGFNMIEYNKERRDAAHRQKSSEHVY